MSAFSRFTPLSATLASTVPFVGPEAMERSLGRTLNARLGANESGFGPSPAALEAVKLAASETWMYADPENYELREALAIHHGIARGNIAVGNGIDGLLGEIVRLVVEPGTPVVTSHGAYPTFNYHVQGFGGRLVTTPYLDDHENLDALLDLVKQENAPLVYFSNPDNPMGSWWDANEVLTFAKALPDTCLLVLDEAYCETAPESAVPSMRAMIGMPNVLRMRTFSKAYGLAGARVGYAIGTIGNAQSFDKIRNHFGMSRMSVAAALAALKDQAYLRDVVKRIASARERIGTIARENGLSPLLSATNFVTIDCHRDGAYAKSIVDGLMAHRVFIRIPGVEPLNRCIRVSVGPKDMLDLFADALPKVLKAVG